jgi:outer membrane protein
MSSFAIAQNRIGFAEPQRILDALPEREEIELQLEEFYVEWENQFNRAYERYSEEIVAYEQARATLSQAQRQNEERALAQMAQELQMMQQQFGLLFDQRRAELTAPVVEKIDTAIRTVAQNMNLDYVFNSETSAFEPMLFVIESNPNTINITDAVIELLTQ